MLRRGFTLVELLVAFSLLALLGVAAAGMVGFGDRVWEATATEGQRIENLAQVDMLLRRQLLSTIPARALGRFAEPPPLFFGAVDGFGWVARSPNQAWPPGLYGQRVRTEQSGEGVALILESWPLDRPSQVRSSRLVEVTSARFAYFGKIDPSQPAAWHERWPRGPIPPKLARIELENERGPLPVMIYTMDQRRE